MLKDFDDKIRDKYGLAGGFVLGMAVVVIVLSWMFISVKYIWPLGIPVVMAAWMIWRVTREGS